MKAKQRWLENCAMNGFIMFDIMFMTATGLENSPHSFHAYTVSQSFSGDIRGESGPTELASVNWITPQSGHVANLQELLYQTGSKKWRNIKFPYINMKKKALIW